MYGVGVIGWGNGSMAFEFVYISGCVVMISCGLLMMMHCSGFGQGYGWVDM